MAEEEQFDEDSPSPSPKRGKVLGKGESETRGKTEELTLEAKKFFDFYKKEVGKSVRKGTNVIWLDFLKLTEFSNKLSDEILSNPEETLRLIESAVEEAGLTNRSVRVRLINVPKDHEIKVRNIRSRNLNEMIVIEGIIRQASDVRPQVVNAKFECPSCGTVMSVLQIEKKFREPPRCSCGRRGGFRLISKEMVDTQRLVVEEAPESLSGGEQPKRINIFVKEDLVEPKMEEKTTPGSRIKVIGVLKEVPIPLHSGGLSTRFELAIEANNVIPLEETFEELDITDEDERQILELSEDPMVFENLARSITPSIWGYEEIKKSLVLQLFSGVQKVHADGQKSRGDIHILLVGDPGVAKSIGKNEKIQYISKNGSGNIPVEELYNKFGKRPKDLKVLTIDQDSHEPRWEFVEEIIKHFPEKELIKIKTEHGKEITATRDHSFITLNKAGDIIPVSGGELTKNSYVPLPIDYHVKMFEYFLPGHFNKKTTNSKMLPEKIKLDEKFGFFIGIFLAEGYIRNEKAVVISNKNKEIQDKVIKLAESLGLNYNKNDKEVSIFSKNLSDILKSYCYNKEIDSIKRGVKGNYSRIKRIPDFLFFSPREFIYGLVSGLFSGDGRLVKDKKMLKGFELISISEELAKNTSDMLFSIGILNKIKKRNYMYKGNKTDCYYVLVPTPMIEKFVKNIKMIGRDIKLNKNKPIYSYNDQIPCGDILYSLVRKLKYNSRISGNRILAAEMRTVKKRGVIGRLRLLNLIEEFEKKTKEKIIELEILKKIAKSNIVWSKITDIELLKERKEEVYDLSIPSTNTFVSNGIGVHNSVTLGFMANISPKGRYVVGKSASGAGLTATVVRDEYLRGWSLEAGAMVLANKGLVCIDELEKMDPNDRSAMHEAMEQQCYHYDTIITLADGSERKIGELVEEALENNKEKVIIGRDCLILPTEELEVFTTDFKDVFKTKVDRISKHKAFDKFIKIKFSNGREIVVTPEHPVFIIENGEIKTQRADSVKIGQDIPIPLKIPINGQRQEFNTDIKNSRAIRKITIPEKNCKEIFKIAGYFISEGSREKNRGKTIGINITNKDERVLDDFEFCMKKVFNLSPYKQIKIDENEPRFMYRYTSTELANFLNKNMPEMMKLSGEKQIPNVLMKGEKQNIAALLSCLFEGDGYVAVKERTIRIGYSTKSRRLAEQIQDLLLRFGIRSNLNKNREYFKTLITSYENIEKFLTEIGFVSQEKNFLIKKYLQEKVIKRTIKDVIPLSFNDKIIEIIKEEEIKRVGKYNSYNIIYDHSIRKDKFGFSRTFLLNLLKQVKKEKNKKLIEKLTSDIGFEKIIGLEIIENDEEKWVYDITIEPNHAFVSQAAILHNTITVSKANVQATLRAETSVLAAANPKFGRFDPNQPIAQQIDLPPTLINRFDIIFTLRDIPDRQKDERIADHVLHEHKKEGENMLIPRELFRKYVAYAKQRIKPELTDEAIKEIKEFYIELRNRPVAIEGGLRPIPISARQLQALIRMSEASAKMRLSKKETKDDSKRAIDIMKYYLMQVGYDYESKTFDIDRIAGRFSSSQRNKILIVRDVIIDLESKMGKMIPVEEIEKELEGKMKKDEIDEAMNKLSSNGDIFIPRKGYVSRTS
jgi:replicative DNA helicase Mcm